jgi:nucleotide-binding universal stress UspA family protein
MYDRLLVPIDGGVQSEHAFAASIELARRLGASITGFIAEPFAGQPSRKGQPFADSATHTDADVHAHAEGVLGRFEHLAREAGVPFRGVATQTSRVVDAIVQAAADHDCDMIVMVTQAPGGVGGLAWGSITRQVLLRTRLPLLVLH